MVTWHPSRMSNSAMIETSRISGTLVISVVPVASKESAMSTFDTIIRGGTVVDGLRSGRYVADIGIRDGRIAAIGSLHGDAAQVLDARGLIVAPGFVDIHTHYDGQITWENTLSPSSGHGVTTVIMGNCGVGFAPARAEDREVAAREIRRQVEAEVELQLVDGLAVAENRM